MRILLVEDDVHTQEILQVALTEQHFLVDQATDGEMAWEMLQQFAYDLVLLDVMLPRLDGIELCHRLRQAKNPVLIMLLTARDSLTDKLLGLESGADDYLTKPINLQELIAHIRTLTRRHPTAATPVLRCDRLCLNPTSREVTYDGQPLKIGRKEYLILELLLRHPHQVFSRTEVIDRLWSLDQEIPTEATVKSHIRSIRRKLEQVGAEDLIETLYGQGYRLNPALLSPADQPLSASAVEEVNNLTAQVWQRAYAKCLVQITELEQAIASLQAGTLDEPLRQQAIFKAHKLAGSLGVFGFDVAAQLAQQVEDQFRQASISPAIAPQLLCYLQALRLELSGRQSSNPKIQTAPLNYQSSPQALTAGTHTRILAIDDDIYLLQQIESILSQEGMQVHSLTHANTLWQTLEQVQPDLLIIDIVLPDRDGLSLSQSIRRNPNWAWIPILILSGRSDRETVNQVFAVGADDYIPKPIAPEDLLIRVTNRLQRQQALQRVSDRKLELQVSLEKL